MAPLDTRLCVCIFPFTGGLLAGGLFYVFVVGAVRELEGSGEQKGVWKTGICLLIHLLGRVRAYRTC